MSDKEKILDVIAGALRRSKERAEHPTETLEQWPAFLRWLRTQNLNGTAVLDEYEVERLCILIERANK